MSDKTKAVKLSRAMRDIPLEAYRLPKHGRKWKSLCRQLMALADFLATYGDGDGTRIEAGVNRMVRKFRVSRRTVFYWLDDLKELGILSNTGKLVSMHGTRVRQLHPAVLATKAGVQNSHDLGVAGVQNTKAGVQNTSTGVQNSGAGVQNTMLHTTASRTDTQPPPPPAQKSRGQVEGVIHLQRAYLRHVGMSLLIGRSQHPKFTAMLDGYSPAHIDASISEWKARRPAPAADLKFPAKWLLDELPDFLEWAKQHELENTVTPEMDAAARARKLEQFGLTEEEFAEMERESKEE